jgi:drug/metabolite transporter (DMT)-like permease
MLIPITMVGSVMLLRARFEPFQIWGSVLILVGAVIASWDSMAYGTSTSTSTSTSASFGLGGSSRSSSTDSVADHDTAGYLSSTGAAAASVVVPAAVILYMLSVIPGAMSNVYKESKLKEHNMNEMFTTTVVSFWQLWFGFLFLPLLALPAYGKRTDSFWKTSIVH